MNVVYLVFREHVCYFEKKNESYLKIHFHFRWSSWSSWFTRQSRYEKHRLIWISIIFFSSIVGVNGLPGQPGLQGPRGDRGRFIINIYISKEIYEKLFKVVQHLASGVNLVFVVLLVELEVNTTNKIFHY